MEHDWRIDVCKRAEILSLSVWIHAGVSIAPTTVSFPDPEVVFCRSASIFPIRARMSENDRRQATGGQYVKLFPTQELQKIAVEVPETTSSVSQKYRMPTEQHYCRARR